MAATDEQGRLLKGCGFLPPSPTANLAFAQSAAKVDFEPTVCPGYAISQPEVVETVALRPSWSKGYLVQHVGDEVPSVAFDAQNVLEGAINTFQAADMKRKAEEAKNGQ